MKALLTLIFCVLNLVGFSQTNITWSAPVSIAASSQDNNHPRITLDRNGNPLVIWGRTTGNMALFSRWNGTAFTTPVMLNTMAIPVFTASWAGPDIASHGDTVYAVFKHTPEDVGYTFIVKSTNGGQSFGAPVRIDNIGDSVSRFPTVTTDVNGNPIVAFMKFNSDFSNARFVVTRSTDLGSTFMKDTRASGFTGGNVCDCCPGAILNSGNNTVMLYRNNLSNIRNIWTGFSTDNGNSFNNGILVDNTNWMIMGCPSTGPDGIILGDSLYTVFMSSGSGASRVYLSSTSVGTQQMASSSRLTIDFTGLTAQNYPRLANAGEEAAVVWKENAQGKARVCFKFTKSINNGFPVAYDTIHTGSLSNVDIAMTPGNIYVVWEDHANGTVMYRKGTYTSSVSIDEPAKKNILIDIYPNPASYIFSVSLQEVVSCTLIDINGRKIGLNGNSGSEGTSFSISGLSNGLYLVELTDKSANSYTSKLLIQNN